MVTSSRPHIPARYVIMPSSSPPQRLKMHRKYRPWFWIGITSDTIGRHIPPRHSLSFNARTRRPLYHAYANISHGYTRPWGWRCLYASATDALRLVKIHVPQHLADIISRESTKLSALADTGLGIAEIYCHSHFSKIITLNTRQGVNFREYCTITTQFSRNTFLRRLYLMISWAYEK